MATIPVIEEDGTKYGGGAQVETGRGRERRKGGPAGEAKRLERAARKLAQAAESDTQDHVSVNKTNSTELCCGVLV